MNEVTRILSAIEEGDPQASEKLLPLVYEELRKLAAQRLAQESPGQTLQATALVHEAYLRLVGASPHPQLRGQESGVRGQESAGLTPDSCLLTPGRDPQRWHSRGHFFAAAAEAMRRILIEQARHKKSAKGGGQHQRVGLDEEQLLAPSRKVDLLALDEALDKLSGQDRRKAELVKLRFFAGLTMREAAAVLGIAESTADADWAYAKSWLRVELADASDPCP